MSLSISPASGWRTPASLHSASVSRRPSNGIMWNRMDRPTGKASGYCIALRLSEMTDYDEKKTTEANSDFLFRIKLIETKNAKVEDLLAK